MARSPSHARSLAQGEMRATEGLPVLNPNAAGADIGAEAIFVCLPGPDQTQIVRSFGTYTADLNAIAAWLAEHGIQTIAMESTGVYWIPLFEVLEGRGLHCCLISGNLARRLPARHKTDVLDCQPAPWPTWRSQPVLASGQGTGWRPGQGGSRPCTAWACSPNPSAPTPT